MDSGNGELAVEFGHHPSGEEFQLYDGGDENPVVPAGTFALRGSVLVDGGVRFGVSATHFDNREELLWMGNSGGHVTSYYGSNMEKYTSFQVVPTEREHLEIRALLPVESGILSLSKDELKCNQRQGLRIFTHRSSHMSDMQCMMEVPGSEGENILLGGLQSSIITFNMKRGTEIAVAEITETSCVTLRSSGKFVCSGDSNGKISVRNPSTLDTQRVLDAHKGSLSDFDIYGNKLVSCGFSTRHGQLQADRFLMLYDLRTMRTLSPIHVPFDPSFVRFIPSFSDSRLLVASQAGEFMMFDIGESSVPLHLDTQGMAVLAVDISTSKQALAFGDAGGMLHLFSDRASPAFNSNSRSTEFGAPNEPPGLFSISDMMTPFSVIPAPFPQDGNYASDCWPHHLLRRYPRVPKPIDPEILRTARQSQFVAYAKNPGGKRRNEMPYIIQQEEISARRAASTPRQRSVSPLKQVREGSTQVPKLYRRVALKPGKLQSEDFNYRNYNQTLHSGLEAPVPNSYCNSLLIVFYHMGPLKNALLNHLCKKEFCLGCELSFLLKMLDQAAGHVPCSANNFVRAFKTIPEASALGLILNDKDEMGLLNLDLSSKFQNFTRFFFHQIVGILEELPKPRAAKSEPSSLIKKNSTFLPPSQVEASDEKGISYLLRSLFSYEILRSLRCICGKSSERTDYPFITPLSHEYVNSEGRIEFGEFVASCLNAVQGKDAWCESCCKYEKSTQSRKIKSLPKVLVLSFNLATDNDLKFLGQQQQAWPSDTSNPLSPNTEPVKQVFKPCRFGDSCNRSNCRYIHTNSGTSWNTGNGEQELTPPSSWITPEINLRLSDGTVNNVAESEAKSEERYHLRSGVFLVKEQDAKHLVTCLKAKDENGQGEEKWHLFNEFVVSRISEREARQFSLDWKVPCVLFFTQENVLEETQVPLSNPIDSSVFRMESSECLAMQRRLSSWTFDPMDEREIPKSGDLVAIDAEFVTLNQEEAEMKSDGTKTTVKASIVSLARVSCIRGTGPKEAVPFIDDYISTPEEVADYLTKFSGIKPGDLDPEMTSKHLTTLKSTYLKLRFLADTGVIFVGHGLINDFRVINILVPQEQVYDTVHLFHLPHHRMVSLRFLAWYFLDLHIQSETHDSIEDAKTALKLYRKYQELTSKDSTNLNTVLTEMYQKGAELDWKVPPR